MNQDKFDKIMRSFESIGNDPITEDVYIVARLDGRCFSSLTKDRLSLAVPFDQNFSNIMVETVKHLMDCGFRAIYGYTESDEISILLNKEEHSFGRVLRKYLSILSSEASSKFSLLLNDTASFDCRLSLLPSIEYVSDYFRWRMSDSSRNCLNSYCYWILRDNGKGVKEASDVLKGLSYNKLIDFLKSHDIELDSIPRWQRYGISVSWESFSKSGINILTNTEEVTTRRRLIVDTNLPKGEQYKDYVARIINFHDENFQMQQMYLNCVCSR